VFNTLISPAPEIEKKLKYAKIMVNITSMEMCVYSRYSGENAFDG